MGGFFGVVSKCDCVNDVYFGVDYHSHLGTKRGGMALYSAEAGFQRAIHNIETSPFRTKFEKEWSKMHGNVGIGCISDADPQPLIIRSHLGSFALSTVGRINNYDELVDELFSQPGTQFLEMNGSSINSTELVGMLINQKSTIPEGIKWAQKKISGSLSVMLMTSDAIYCGRDQNGRLPIIIGQKEEGTCASFESFAFEKLGYVQIGELGPGEVVKLTAEGAETVVKADGKLKICSFLWSYYGYPNSRYEGKMVETMRYRCGEYMAEDDKGKDLSIDFVAGIPDSGTAHAIGYSNRSHIPFARPFIKYTPTWPRSFMPAEQSQRNLIAHMKLVPVRDLIENHDLLFVDDSIVRGTQMRETVDFLYKNGARSVHIRSAAPPIIYGCKYLSFSRSSSEMELITRKTVAELEGPEGFRHLKEYADPETERAKSMVCSICKKLKFTTLGYISIKNMISSIGLSADDVCTYCFDGKE